MLPYNCMGAFISSASKGFADAGACVILTLSPSVKLLTWGGMEGVKNEQNPADVICEHSLYITYVTVMAPHSHKNIYRKCVIYIFNI